MCILTFSLCCSFQFLAVALLCYFVYHMLDLNYQLDQMIDFKLFNEPTEYRSIV